MNEALVAIQKENAFLFARSSIYCCHLMSLVLAYQIKTNRVRDSKTSTAAKHSSINHHINNLNRDSRDSIFHLQRAIGNQAVQRLMRSEGADFDFAKIGIFQPKLKVSQPGDAYEQEADRMVEQVMSMSTYDVITSTTPHSKEEEQVRRKCSICEMKQKEDERQLNISRKPSTTSNSETADEITDEISNIRSSAGTLLDLNTKEFMESRFGYDFSRVRIHDDSKAKGWTVAVGARAFTVGSDVFLGRNESPSDRRLMAHELTHVIQQAGLAGNIAQRTAILENDPGTAPALSCPLATDSVADYLITIPFTQGGAALTRTEKLILADFATKWNLSPVQPVIRIDGFASIEGGPARNWGLSCDRALAVAAELNAPSIGTKPGIPATHLEFFANGETDRFSSSYAPNRVATIHAPGMASPTSNEPSVHSWTVNNSGRTDADNCCSLCPANLGVDSDPPAFRNGIELIAAIRDHNPSYAYNIKRTKEAKYHRKRDHHWETINAWNKPAGSDDDGHDSDECLSPVESGSVDNIFAQDRPGWRAMSSTIYNAYLQKINFIEFVRIQRPSGSTYDSALKKNWHTTLLVEKSHGVWSVDTHSSEIGTGHLASLDP